MAPMFAWVLLLAILGVEGSGKETELELNGKCKQSSDLSVTCKLRTLNSEFERTNLSSIPGENVLSLSVECSHVLFYQSSLPAASLLHFSRLTQLNIQHCKLTRLPQGVFQGLAALSNLTITTHNTAWPALSLDIQQGVFGPLTHLQRVDLSQNNIWTLPENLFCPAASLRFLNLSLNRIQDVSDLSFRDKDGDDSSGCRMGIQVLDLSRNRLILLPSKALAKLGSLKELYLQHNEISNVAEGALAGLKGLKILNLAENKLSNLPSNLFLESREVSEIHLENNSLSSLSAAIFSGLDHLLVLDLSHNSLSSLWTNGGAEGASNGTGPFSGLIRLVLLNLGHNRLSHLVPQSFLDLYSLQILDLQHNQIESIDSSAFSAMNNLHTLLLSHNQLSTIEATSLHGLFVLSLLSLDNNKLSSIHEQAFHNCSSLKDLNLNSNNLLNIPLALQNLTMLKTVDLGENGIEQLQGPPRLIGLPNLYGLRLTGNRIVNVSKEALEELPSLKVLNLARNRIQSVEGGAFDSNANLQAVRLDANYLTDMSHLFLQTPSLIWLNMSDNHLTWFDYALIPPQLQWIDLHKNQINTLGNFYARTDLRLQTLDVSFNRIERLSSVNVPDSIEMIFLNDNLISHIEPHTFFNKVNLSRVDLFANQLQTLDLAALRLTPFPEDRPLPEVYMGGNPIVCDCNMEWLQSINQLDHLRQHPKVMDLDSVLCQLPFPKHTHHLPLTLAPPTHFLCPYTNHCFHLCHCCDFQACDCQMTCPDNCTCYHDDTWNNNIADCAAQGHVSVPATIPMDATQVHLDGNDLDEVPSHAFIARKNLQILFLNNSAISRINNNSFNGLKRLAVLHLDNNRLTQLNGHEFQPLESLRELYLHANQLTFIANNTFLTLRSLEVLRLDGNRLTRFAIWTLAMNPYLVEIGLSLNPFSCDCQYVAEAGLWVKDNVAKIIDVSELNCHFQGKDLSLLNMNGTQCSEIRALSGEVLDSPSDLSHLPLAVGLGALTLLILLILLAVYRKRVCGSSKCPFQCKCYTTTLDTDDREKLYDAYVAYSVKDEAWVTQVMASELTQNDSPLRLLLHYKEFGGTSCLSDTIVEAVECSKRTVLILSKNFVQSEWARFEFKSALHAALRGKRNRLVAVTLGDLPTRDLDPDLRVALRSATLLSANDKLFWTKLKAALPRPRISYTLGRQTQAYSSGRQAQTHAYSSVTPAQTYSESNGGCSGVGVPVYMPPFPPPNRPPPPFPTPRRPPPPAPLHWA